MKRLHEQTNNILQPNILSAVCARRFQINISLVDASSGLHERNKSQTSSLKQSNDLSLSMGSVEDERFSRSPSPPVLQTWEEFLANVEENTGDPPSLQLWEDILSRDNVSESFGGSPIIHTKHPDALEKRPEGSLISSLENGIENLCNLNQSLSSKNKKTNDIVLSQTESCNSAIPKLFDVVNANFNETCTYEISSNNQTEDSLRTQNGERSSPGTSSFQLQTDGTITKEFAIFAVSTLISPLVLAPRQDGENEHESNLKQLDLSRSDSLRRESNSSGYYSSESSFNKSQDYTAVFPCSSETTSKSSGSITSDTSKAKSKRGRKRALPFTKSLTNPTKRFKEVTENGIVIELKHSDKSESASVKITAHETSAIRETNPTNHSDNKVMSFVLKYVCKFPVPRKTHKIVQDNRNKLPGLIKEETFRTQNDLFDLRIRNGYTIQLIAWERFHRIFLSGKIHIRLLIRCNMPVILIMPPNELVALDMTRDIRDMATEKDVPFIVNELLASEVSQSEKPRYAFLLCDGAKWELIGSLYVRNSSDSSSSSDVTVDITQSTESTNSESPALTSLKSVQGVPFCDHSYSRLESKTPSSHLAESISSTETNESLDSRRKSTQQSGARGSKVEVNQQLSDLQLPKLTENSNRFYRFSNDSTNKSSIDFTLPQTFARPVEQSTVERISLPSIVDSLPADLTQKDHSSNIPHHSLHVARKRNILSGSDKASTSNLCLSTKEKSSSILVGSHNRNLANFSSNRLLKLVNFPEIISVDPLTIQSTNTSVPPTFRHHLKVILETYAGTCKLLCSSRTRIILPLDQQDDEWIMIAVDSVPDGGPLIPCLNLFVNRNILNHVLSMAAQRSNVAVLFLRFLTKPDQFVLTNGLGLYAFPQLSQHVFLGPIRSESLKNKELPIWGKRIAFDRMETTDLQLIDVSLGTSSGVVVILPQPTYRSSS